MGALEDAVEALYAADLDAFTATRTELAKAAKSGGDREAAAAITALRKPTVAAFTVNRLARTDPDAIEQLIDLGRRLQQAQRTTDASAMRDLNKERRQLLSELVTRAFDVVGQQAPSAAAQEDVSATFQAALADSSVAEALRAGTLVKAAESAGFGFTTPELTVLPGGAPARTGGAAKDARQKTGAGKGAGTGAARQNGPRAEQDKGGREKAGAKEAPDEAADKAADKAAEKARREKEGKEKRQEEKRQAERERAQAEVTAADTAVDEAVAAIGAAQQRIRKLQHELLDARADLESAQQAARTAEARQKKARTALNRL